MNAQTRPTLERFFDPSSVAVVGASPGEGSLAGRIVEHLDMHGYERPVYPVNPNYDEVHGRTCYDGVGDIPSSPSHAYVLVPAKVVEAVVRECGEAGVEFVVVGASGFSETGHQDRESKLAELAETYDMSVFGPNSIGLINTNTNLALSFSSACQRDIQPGGLGIVSQSGGLAGALLQMAQRKHIGLSKWISTGNEAHMSLLDILEYYVESPEVEVAVAFIEGAGDGTRLREIGRRALETETPVLVLKAGDSESGQEATASHTGRISDTGEIYTAAFEETGIVRLDSIQAYLDAITAFTTVPTDHFPKGRGVGVLSASGGACALIADAAERLGMELPALPDETVDRITEKLPEYGSATNPIDATAKVGSDLEFFGSFVEDIATSPTVDATLLQLGNTGPDYIEPIQEELYRIVEETNKPIVASFAGGWPDDDLLINLQENGIPSYSDPDAALRALRDMATWRERANDPPEITASRSRGATQLGQTWDELASAASSAGVDIVEHQTVTDADEAVEAAEAIGFPVTLKLDAPDLDHKTEIAGVITDRRTAVEVRDATGELLETARRHEIDDATVLVQEHIDGFEVVCGCFGSEEFGPVMMVGPGGVFVELFGDDVRDYVFLPTGESAIDDTFDRGSLGTLLENYRGTPLARDKLVETLAGFAELYLESDVAELEANPIIVTDDRAVAVDLVGR